MRATLSAGQACLGSMDETAETRRTTTAAKEAPKEGDAAKSTFVDAAAMKEKVRQKLSRPKHVVSDYYKSSGICQAIAKSPHFDKATLGVIGLNAVWIAVDTDWNDASLLLEAHPVFIFVENLFCSFFTFEWFVRYMSFRNKRDGLKDMWFVFDSFMVVMMVLETWCFTIITIFFIGDNASGGNTGVLKAARLLRLSRMARMARLLRAMPELMIMIKGMMAATRSVFFTLCLEAIILYVFSIAFAQLANGTDAGKRYFSSVPEAMFTLLIYGTFLDNIAAFSETLSNSSILFTVMFFIFVLIGSLTVMNMLVGVLCEVVSATASIEQEEMLVSYVNDKLSKVMYLLDTDGGGSISKKEFIEILDNVDAVRCMNDVGVDVFALVDLADYIFVDDTADQEVELDFSKFMEVVLQLRGTNQATVKDVVDLRKFIRLAMLESTKQINKAMDRIEHLAEAGFKQPENMNIHEAMPPVVARKVPEASSTTIEIGSPVCSLIDSNERYEVEVDTTPRLPQETSPEEFLSASDEENRSRPPLCEDCHTLKGDWAPYEMDRLVLPRWRIPTENELQCKNGLEPGGFAKPGHLKWYDVSGFSSGFVAGKTTNETEFFREADDAPFLMLDERDMEDVRKHVDAMSKQLATSLHELLAKIQSGMRESSLRATALTIGQNLVISNAAKDLCKL